MKNSHQALLTLGLVVALAGAAHAQSEAPAPGVVVQGSSNVQSGNLPAARVGDATSNPDGGVVEGSSNVFINGKPMARVGDNTSC
jgi:uncharacterized Zn-binding protein involved in type VI secretion